MQLFCLPYLRITYQVIVLYPIQAQLLFHMVSNSKGVKAEERKVKLKSKTTEKEERSKAKH